MILYDFGDTEVLNLEVKIILVMEFSQWMETYYLNVTNTEFYRLNTNGSQQKNRLISELNNLYSSKLQHLSSIFLKENICEMKKNDYMNK